MSSRPDPHRRASPRRLLINPLASLVLAAIIILIWRDGRTNAEPGWIAHRWLGIHAAREIVVAHATSDGVRLLHPDRDSWDEASQLLTTDPTHTLVIELDLTTSRTGLVQPLLHREHATWAARYGSALTPPQRHDAITRAINDLAQRAAHTLDHPLARDAFATTGRHTRAAPIWPGIAALAAFALALPAFVLSMAWFRPARWWRARRQRRRDARGLCLACGYDRAGLEPDNPCPECGQHPPDTLIPRP